MVKKRHNFTLEDSAKRRLKQLSDESFRYVGRKLSQSEVIEYLVNKAFVDKRELLEKQYNKLKIELESIEAEMMACKIREKKVTNPEW